jgi:hypothetical protein
MACYMLSDLSFGNYVEVVVGAARPGGRQKCVCYRGAFATRAPKKMTAAEQARLLAFEIRRPMMKADAEKVLTELSRFSPAYSSIARSLITSSARHHAGGGRTDRSGLDRGRLRDHRGSAQFARALRKHRETSPSLRRRRHDRSGNRAATR